MARGSAAALVLVVVAMANLMAEPARAINCVDVDMALRQCVPYLTGQAAEPAAACCAGIAHLKNIATTTPERQAACSCVKEAASHLSGLKDDAVSTLPAKCNAPLPYPISAAVDCTK